MFKILLFISVITAIFCMCLVLGCSIASTKKYESQDIENFEFLDPLALEIKKEKVLRDGTINR